MFGEIGYFDDPADDETIIKEDPDMDTTMDDESWDT